MVRHSSFVSRINKKAKLNKYILVIVSSIATFAALLANIETIIEKSNKWFVSSGGVELISFSTDTDRTFLVLESENHILKFKYNLEDRIINGWIRYNPDTDIKKVYCDYDESLAKYSRGKWDFGLGENEQGGINIRFGIMDGYNDCVKIIDKIKNIPLEQSFSFHDPVFDIVLLNKTKNKLVLKEIDSEIIEFRHPRQVGAPPYQYDQTFVIKPAIEYEINLPELLKTIYFEFPEPCTIEGLLFPDASTKCETLLSELKEYLQKSEKHDRKNSKWRLANTLGLIVNTDLTDQEQKEWEESNIKYISNQMLKLKKALSLIKLSDDGYPIWKTYLNDKILLNPDSPVRFQIRLPTDPPGGSSIVMRFKFLISDRQVVTTKPIAFWYDW